MLLTFLATVVIVGLAVHKVRSSSDFAIDAISVLTHLLQRLCVAAEIGELQSMEVQCILISF